MFGLPSRLAWRDPFLALLVLTGIPLTVSATDLYLEIGEEDLLLRSQEYRGHDYYRIADFAPVVGLSVTARGSEFEIKGDRGQLKLTADRPLVEVGEHLILLSAPAWRRSRDEWWVTPDFFRKVLPLIIDGRLIRVTDRRYRLESVLVNPIRVEVVNYPDHVSIVFRPARLTRMRTRELRGRINVAFDRFRAQPQFSSTRPDPRLVSGIQFDEVTEHGTFGIVKGPDYDSFRQYELSDPPRNVIDIYPKDRYIAGPITSQPLPGSRPPTGPVLEPGTSLDEETPELQTIGRDNVITIDPGHGGENYGAQVASELFEKTLAFQLGQLLEQALGQNLYEGILTRNRDIALSLEQRSALSNHHQSVAFVSLHFGSSPNLRLRGAVVYVHRPQAEPAAGQPMVAWEDGQFEHLARSRELAAGIQTNLNQLFGVNNRVAEAPLAILAPLTAPAVLIEAGFLSSEQDLADLRRPGFQQQLAEAIALALTEFLQ